MAMELDIDFIAYMWILGILMVLVAMVGYFVVSASFRQHNRRREETMAGSRSDYPWNANSPDSFGHG